MGPLLKPGCTAADNAIVAQGHLRGLADGKGGFGVLKQSKERLEEAAKAARILGKNPLAAEMILVANKLPNIHDAAAARLLADQIQPIIDQTWDLGRYCKGAR